MGGIFTLVVPTGLLVYSISNLMFMFSSNVKVESIDGLTMLGAFSASLIGLIGGGISINAISTWINSHKP